MTSLVVITCGSSPVWRGKKKKAIWDCSIFLGKMQLSSESRDRKEGFCLFGFCLLCLQAEKWSLGWRAVGEPGFSHLSFLVADPWYKSPGRSQILLTPCKMRPRVPMHGGCTRESVRSTSKAVRTLLFFLKLIFIFLTLPENSIPKCSWKERVNRLASLFRLPNFRF